jgi:hypothetical protein
MLPDCLQLSIQGSLLIVIGPFQYGHILRTAHAPTLELVQWLAPNFNVKRYSFRIIAKAHKFTAWLRGELMDFIQERKTRYWLIGANIIAYKFNSYPMIDLYRLKSYGWTLHVVSSQRCITHIQVARLWARPVTEACMHLCVTLIYRIIGRPHHHQNGGLSSS